MGWDEPDADPVEDIRAEMRRMKREYEQIHRATRPSATLTGPGTVEAGLLHVLQEEAP